MWKVDGRWTVRIWILETGGCTGKQSNGKHKGLQPRLGCHQMQQKVAEVLPRCNRNMDQIQRFQSVKMGQLTDDIATVAANLVSKWKYQRWFRWVVFEVSPHHACPPI